MLITKLAAYARENNLVDDPLFEDKRVHFTLTLARDGSFMQIAPTEGTRGVVGVTPKKAGKNAPSVPAFGTDKASFVFGLANVEAGAAKAERDLAAFAQLTHTAATARPDLATFGAADRFYADQARVLAACQQARTVGVKESHIVAIAMVDDMGVWLANTAAGKSFWRDHRAIAMIGKPTAGAVACLSCGRAGAPVRTADTKIVGLLPPPPGDGRALVSFDKDAFQSHGWDKNANAAVCEECSQAYTRGLNHLLKRDNSPRTRIDEGGVAFVAWADAAPPSPPPNGADRDAIDLEELLRGMEQGLLAVIDEPNTDHAIAVFQAISSGKPLVGEPDRRLYVLGLRGNGGRAVVVDWFDVALPEAYKNAKRWFDDLQIQLIFDQTRTDPKTKVREVLQEAGSLSQPIALRTLARATARKGEKPREQISVALLRAALFGDQLSLAVAHACIARLTLDGFGGYLAVPRVGLIRAAINPHLERKLQPMLDPTNDDAAYVCGRLLATLEDIQFKGVGDVGATVISRFYGRASSAPRLVFGHLLSLAIAHLNQVDFKGTRSHLERQIGEIIGLLGATESHPDQKPEFPATFSVVDQGQFAIGYWHQKADIRARQAERKAAQSATTSKTTTGDPS